MKRPELARKKSRLSGSPAHATATAERNAGQFVVCVSNTGFPASLELRKICRLLPDDAAATRGLPRVVDESRGDELYPRDSFPPIGLPTALEQALP